MNNEVLETLTSKKIDNYYSELRDFAIEKELTVTITLNEYRHLIKESATKEIDIKEAEKDKYTREDENRRLKEINKTLENTIFEYRKKYGEFIMEEEEE